MRLADALVYCFIVCMCVLMCKFVSYFVCVILCIFVFLCDILLPSGVINDDDRPYWPQCSRPTAHFPDFPVIDIEHDHSEDRIYC